MQAIESYARAIQLEPKSSAYKQKFIDLVQYMEVRQENPALKGLFLECLKDTTLDFSGAGQIWLGLFLHDTVLRKAYDKKDYAGLLNPFFLLGLQRLVAFSVEFENFLTGMRRYLLENEKKELTPLEQALAVYCAATDYIFYTAPDEEKKIESLKGRPAIVNCYRRPSAKTDKSIRAVTPISDAISSAVREQYEEFPYPRWTHFDPNIKDRGAEGYLEGKAADILVAGCGTGKEAIELAAAFPKSKILAVDLSLASLSYGSAKAEEFGIKNIDFAQGDILNLGALDKKFDFIASSGVLHHLDDPFKGWSVLTGLLKSKGTMRIALYSRAARAKLTETKKIITQKNYGRDSYSIRRFRHDAPKILKKDVYKDICNFRDYYFLSECRDLLFHVQEHEYNPLEIEDMLGRLGLEFVKFYLHPDILVQYTGKFPKDKEARNLKNWQQFEDRKPETFREMFKFWCRKP